ncbi:MAG TPA: hypothetical protein VGJ33_18760 [Candidatus Angelobacter sp.]|jgi:hypothetical protein
MADITGKLCRQTADRHIDAGRNLCAVPLAGNEPLDLREASDLELGRDRAEGIRVVYVAATRARGLLVVPTIGDDPRTSLDSVENWWVWPLYDAINPEAGDRQMSEEAGGVSSLAGTAF